MNKTTLLKVFRSVYFLITGIVVIPLATFFASGGIGESYGGTEFPAPEFFWLNAIWMIGLVVHFKKLWLGVIIAIIPVIYFGVLFIIAS